MTEAEEDRARGQVRGGHRVSRRTLQSPEGVEGTHMVCVAAAVAGRWRWARRVGLRGGGGPLWPAAGLLRAPSRVGCCDEGGAHAVHGEPVDVGERRWRLGGGGVGDGEEEGVESRGWRCGHARGAKAAGVLLAVRLLEPARAVRGAGEERSEMAGPTRRTRGRGRRARGNLARWQSTALRALATASVALDSTRRTTRAGGEAARS